MSTKYSLILSVKFCNLLFKVAGVDRNSTNRKRFNSVGLKWRLKGNFGRKSLAQMKERENATR